MPDPAIPRPATLLMRLERAGPARLLLLLLAFHAAVHARYLAMPPAGYHLWRQVDTLSVARNFHEEGMDLFRPGVDRRGGGDGVTGMEFTLLNYAIALVYRVAGVSPLTQRVPILILSCLAVAAFFRLARRLFGSLGLAFVAGAILVLSPLFTYYSIAAIPEIPVIALVCLGLAALAGARENGRTAPAVTGIALLGLAALMKPPMVIPCAPAAAWLAAPVAWRARARGRIALVLAAALAGATVLGWYDYARALTTRSGNEVFALQAAFPYPLAIAPAILGKNLFQWLPELYLNYGSFVWFVIGVIALLRSRADGRALPARGFVVAYAIGAALHLVLRSPRSSTTTTTWRARCRCWC